MFCKWCGNKIKNNGVPCPHCGQEQGKLENGNGFWDLCDISPDNGQISVHTNNNSDNISDNSSKNVPETKRKPSGFTAVISVVLALIAVCVASYSLYNTILLSNQISTMKSEMKGMKKSFKKQVAKLEKKLDSASKTEDNEDIWSNIDSAELTNEVSIECITEDDSLLYIASGNMVSDENTETCWQKSYDSGETWETVATDTTEYRDAKDSDALYRIVLYCDGNYFFTQYNPQDPNTDSTGIDETEPQSETTQTTLSSEEQSTEDSSSE